MIVEVLAHVAGARAARGTAVVSDLFRAFATAAYAVDAGVVPQRRREMDKVVRLERIDLPTA